MDFLLYPLALIVTLGLLVTFHEAGHYVVARLAGVKILRFSIGFGKPVWVRRDVRGTEFVVAVVPLGGYVRMYDERDGGDAALAPGELSYNAVTPWWRIAIALGGPAANFVLALLVYWMMFLGGTTAAVPITGAAPADSPAAAAGLAAGEVIRAVDGSPVRSWQEIAIALAGRLGDTGSIVLEVAAPGSESGRLVEIGVSQWHRGEADPDLFGSLGLVPGWPAVIGLVEDGGAADRAGLELWDEIEAVDGVPLAGWSAWVDAIQAAPGRVLQLSVLRDGRTRLIDVRPGAVEATNGETIGYLGVGWPTNVIEYSLLGALVEGVRETGAKTMLTLGLIGKMVTGDVSVANLSSPIMIAKVAGDSARSGWWAFAGVLALLSISLGVLNLLPIPILDGGHILYCVGELVTGRPVSERVQILGSQVGLALVVGFLVLAVYNDLLRLF
jgi:regulator of sigma E protease